MPEHGTVLLPGPAELRVNGLVVPRRSNAPTGPFIETVETTGVLVNVHDWVGALAFSGVGGDHTVHVFPGKLAAQPAVAFAALARLVEDLSDLTGSLHYPSELVTDISGLTTRPPDLSDLEGAARQAWQLTRTWRHRPRTGGGWARRVARGGAVPDRVDWELTLDHWGQGGFPDHVARDLRAVTAADGDRALRALWEAVAAAADAQPAGSDLAVRSRKVAASLGPATPGQGGRVDRADALGRAVSALTARVQAMRRRSAQLPTGHARMPDLYELWAQAAVLRALDATSGEFVRDGQGRFTGTFRGPDVTVTVSPRLGFRGVGQAHEQLMPDLLAVFDMGPALVFDVKYRSLDRFSAAQQRAVNAQLLGYMGLTHAAVGAALWPAPADEPFLEGRLPGARARLLRVRCHPLDPPGAFRDRLHALHLPGVA